MDRREAALRNLEFCTKLDYEDLEKRFANYSTEYIENVTRLIQPVLPSASVPVILPEAKPFLEALGKTFERELPKLVIPDVIDRTRKEKPIRREPFYSKFVKEKRR